MSRSSGVAALVLCLAGVAHAKPAVTRPAAADEPSTCETQLAATQRMDALNHRAYVADLQSKRACDAMMVEHEARRMAFVAERINRLDNFILAAMAAALVTATAAVALLLLRERAHATESERNTLTTLANTLVAQSERLVTAVGSYRRDSAGTFDADSTGLGSCLEEVRQVYGRLRKHADEPNPTSWLKGDIEELSRRVHELGVALATRAKDDRAHEERVRELAEQARASSDSAQNLTVRISTLRAFPAQVQVSQALTGTLFLVCIFGISAGVAAVWGVPAWTLHTASAMPAFDAGVTCTAPAPPSSRTAVAGSVGEAGDDAGTQGASAPSSSEAPPRAPTPPAAPKAGGK